MFLNSCIDLVETLLQSADNLRVRIKGLYFFVKLCILLFYDLRQLGFNVRADFLSVLAMAVANSEEMQRRQLRHVWGEDVLILVNFVGVVRVKAYPGSKRKLPYTVFAFHDYRFSYLNLIRSRLRGRTPRNVVAARYLLLPRLVFKIYIFINESLFRRAARQSLRHPRPLQILSLLRRNFLDSFAGVV